MQAEQADIVMMLSGPEEAIAQALKFTPHFTKKTIEAGSFGAGSRLKFVANHAVALHNTAAAETMAYADAMRLDRQTVYDMLSSGAGQSKMSDLRMPLMIDSAYVPPTASLKMFEKDLSVIGDDIKRLGLYAPLFDCCDALYKEASATLPETYDTASVFEVYRAKSKG
jgi:3-hydroxyisobutyrate dehydrogenase-like beta-hydroxyacid dehydrogenase